MGSTRESLVECIFAWGGIKNAFRNEGVRSCSLDILFIADEDFQRTKTFDTTVRNALGILTDIHVYLYRFNQDDTIKDTEEIA